MNVQRLFLSGAMNPAAGGNTPSGVPNATVAPSAPVGGYGATAFPAMPTGGGILVTNHGSTPLALWYVANVTTPFQPTPGMVANAVAGMGGKVNVPAFQSTILTDAAGSPAVAYVGGGFSAVAGTFQYSVACEPVDYPGAEAGL